MQIPTEDKKILIDCLITYNNWLEEHIRQPILKALNLVPAEIDSLLGNLKNIMHNLQKSPPNHVEDQFIPLLKQAVIHKRRECANSKERRSSLTFHSELRDRLEEEVNRFDKLINQDWFKNTEKTKSPKLTDYISIKSAEKILMDKGVLNFSQRIQDEKFNILESISLFPADLEYYRLVCELRGRPISVVYMDIDEFKSFNTDYTEPIVDREILSRFMSTLETHVFSYGHAYRHGGDEYLVLLPNMSNLSATVFFAEFQNQLQKIKYVGINRNPTVSIGIFVIDENCYLTNTECVDLAAKAKKFAKDNGKNCIAIYEDRGSSASDLQIVVKNGSPVDEAG